MRAVWYWASTAAVALAAATCSGDLLPTTGQQVPSALARVSGDGQSGSTGQTLTDPLVVMVTDVGGQGISGVTVTWSVLAGGGSLSASNTATDASGQASVSLTLGAVAGSNSVSATVNGLAAVTFAASAIAGASAPTLSFSVQPGNVTAGTVMSPAVKVAVRDSAGNVVTTSAASITVALSNGTGAAGAHLRGTVTVSAVNGVATFSTLSVDSAGTGYTLTARASGLTGATSGAFNVVAAPAARLSFTAQPSTAAAGAVIAPPVKVAVRDSVGNVVTASTASITVALTNGTGTAGAHLGGTVTVSAASGVATFSTLSVDLVGTGYTLTASATGLTSATSGSFNVAAASTSRLSFSVQPANVTAGRTISPAVQVAVHDSLGNVVTSSTASITVALSNGTGTAGAHLRGTVTVSAANGVATFSTLSVDSVGTGYALAASASGMIGTTSGAFSVAVAPAARLGFAVQPTATVAGAAIAPAVKVAVRDSLGNAVTSSTASITVALGGTGTAGAHLRGTVTVTAAGGVATFSTLSVDSVGAGYALTASASGLAGATSTAFNVTAAPPAKLGFAVQPSRTTSGAAITPAVKVAVRDSIGNVVTASTASVAVALTSGTGKAGAHLGGSTTVSAISGVATFSTLTVDSVGTGYTLTATSTGLASAISTAFAVDSAASGTTYTTNFPLTENPISEGGRWINGGTTGLDWTDVVTTTGFAYGTEVNGNYSDATAILTGTWPANQYAQATVYWNPNGNEPVPEVELRLRSAISAHVNRGYEITVGGGYLIIVRWNGPFQSFNYLLNASGSQYTPKTGDVIRATIVGNTITAYKNGVQMGQATDGTWTDGAPGMGFNSGAKGGTYDNTYGFTSFTAGPM